MAKFTSKGINEYVAYLQKVGQSTDEAVEKAVYSMADVVANKVRSNIQALPTVSNEANVATYRQGYSRLSEPEKQGLLDGFGISRMQDENGFRNVKLGFDGYNSVKTKKYPKGQPNVLIARVTESGSRYRVKSPFVRTAVTASRSAAIKAGQGAFDEVVKGLE